MLELEALTGEIIGAAICVHRELGPGLLESTYELCLHDELIARNLRVERQVDLPVTYRGRKIDCGYRMDMVVERKVLLELKSIDKLARIHEAQLMSYLKLSGLPVGFLINFNVEVLKSGIVRRALTNRSASTKPHPEI